MSCKPPSVQGERDEIDVEEGGLVDRPVKPGIILRYLNVQGLQKTFLSVQGLQKSLSVQGLQKRF